MSDIQSLANATQAPVASNALAGNIENVQVEREVVEETRTSPVTPQDSDTQEGVGGNVDIRA